MDLRFEPKNINAIVRVECEGESGTAFFVLPNTLLTARHVVISAADKDDRKAVILVNGNPIDCKVYSECADGNATDIARLECEVSVDGIIPLPLLKMEMRDHPEFIVGGFPSASGIGSTVSWYEVTYEQAFSHTNYDQTAILSEIYSTQKLKGLSGGPIMNSSGSVIGIESHQIGRSIGFCSIARYATHRANALISINENARREDLTTFGLGRSIELTKSAIKTVGNRYNKDADVPNENLLKTLKDFVAYERQSAFDVLPSIEKRIERVFMESKVTPNLNEDNKPDYFSTYKELQDKKKLDVFVSDNQNELPSLIEKFKKLSDQKNTWEKQLLLLRGKAGSGKTHTLCGFLDENKSEINRYLLLGSNFEPYTPIEAQICDKLGFGDRGLARLNDAVKDTLALIVIDALNEGANLPFWRSQLDTLHKVLEHYKHIKVVISIRSPFDKLIMPSDEKMKFWKDETIDGFEDLTRAIDKYLSEAHIDKSYAKQYREELKNPLFMNIFCKTFNSLTEKEREELTKIILFENYLKIRNARVSEIADEDIYRQITPNMIQKLAHYSVFYNNCDLVTRNRSRVIANRICYRQLWSNHLLNALLQEGLLLETLSTNLDSNLVQIEYEKMGDFFKAQALLNSKMDNEQLEQFVLDMEKHVSAPGYVGNKAKFVNMLTALMAIWHGREKFELSEHPRLVNLAEKYSESLKDESGPYQEFFLNTYYENSLPIRVSDYWDERKTADLERYKSLHSELTGFTLPERDLRWSDEVNHLFDKIEHTFLFINDDVKDAERREILYILFGWFFASSYPLMRYRVSRRLTAILQQYPNDCLPLMKRFVAVNDPYVVQGILASIYGCCLIVQDKDLTDKIAEYLHITLFEPHSEVLYDLIVRQWAIKLLDLAHYLNPNSELIHEAKSPLVAKDDSLSRLVQVGVKEEKDCFGIDQGSWKLWYSLYDFSDFNRYIIGTNSSNTSNVFFFEDENKKLVGINLMAMANEMSAWIKSHGWNSLLGKRDSGRYSDGRYDNRKERLGKKYQWLSLYNLEGRLMDSANVVDVYGFNREPMAEDVVDEPRAWNTGDYSYYDPTLQEPGDLDQIVQNIFVQTEEANFDVDLACREWLDDVTILPSTQYVYTDKNNNQWIRLFGYETRKGNAKNGTVEEFLFYNSGLVPVDKADAVAEWAKNQMFHGRWMPEHRNGVNHCLWLEYPWAEYYQQNNRCAWEDVENGCPSDILLPYETLLQEHTMGLWNADDVQHEVLAPCAEMMDSLGLQTSTYRGVIKTKDGETVAVNMCPYVREHHNGLLIRKDYLDKYLASKGYVLFYFILGEKTAKNMKDESAGLTLDNTDLSAAAVYTVSEGITEVQPMRHRGSFQKEHKEEDDFVIDTSWVDGSKKRPSMTTRQMNKFLEFIEKEKLIISKEQDDGC